MPYKGGQQTLLGFICSPFMGSITRKPLFGSPYARGVNYLGVKSQLYQIGAALGHALKNKLDTLVKFLLVPDAENQKVNEIVRLCKKDAEKNLEEYKNKFGQEPDTFDDFAFYWWIGNLVKTAGIRLSPREAFKAYLSGDRKIKRLFDRKVDTEGMGQEIMTMLLEGIYFGSTFPKLTEKMYQNAYKDDKDYWGVVGQGLTVPEGLKVKSLEETERAVLQIVEVYTSKYYPELIDPLGLQLNKSRVDMQAHEPSKYEILNEILLTEGKNLIGKHFKHPELLGQSTNVSIDPFNPSDYEYLVSAFLGGPSHIGHFDSDRLETILKKLLQDDYERYYQTARQNIVSRHTRPPYGKGNNQAD